MNEYNITILTLAVFLLLLYLFYRRTRLPLLTTRIYTSFLWFAVFNAVAEVILITCAYMHSIIPFYIIRIIQKCNLISIIMLSLLFFLYLYVQTFQICKSNFYKHLPVCIPAFIGCIFTVCSSARRGFDENGHFFNSDYGILITDAVTIFYMLAVVVLIACKHKAFKQELIAAEIIGVVFWAFFSILQFTLLGERTTSASVLAFAALLFISAENPRDYSIRNYSNLMNRYAFERLLSDLYRQKKSFVILVLTLTDKKYLLFEEDRRKIKSVLNGIAEMEIKANDRRVFQSGAHTICMIMDNKEDAGRFIGALEQSKDKIIGSHRYCIDLLEIPKYAATMELALQVIDYLGEEYSYEQKNTITTVETKHINKMLYRKTVEDILLRAIAEHGFEVYYQPIFGIREQSFVSAEALVRIKGTSSMGFISPEFFIPIAERLDLIHEIDDQVFEQVCSFYSENDLASLGIHHIEINLSGKEVMDSKTSERLMFHMKKYGIRPGHINFEITETACIENDENVQDNLKSLRDIGCSFSMDDFGSGYSNLKGILQMQFNMIKLDREFVWLCLNKEDKRNMKMLDLCVQFMKGYGMNVLAEGIETKYQNEMMIEHGVEYIQGFYYSEPLTEEEFIEFLKEKNLNQQSTRKRFSIVGE